MILAQFQTIGADLFNRSLVSSSGGNLSLRMGNRLMITRHGSRLNGMQENDLIETGIDKNDRSTPLASIELPVHRAIYRKTSAQAIVHAHPPHSIALSLLEKVIEPQSVEGREAIGAVPVLGWDVEVQPGSMADVIAEALVRHRIVMVRGHGSFAIGQLLEEAYNYTSTLEESCQIIVLLRSLKASGTPEK